MRVSVARRRRERRRAARRRAAVAARTRATSSSCGGGRSNPSRVARSSSRALFSSRIARTRDVPGADEDRRVTRDAALRDRRHAPDEARHRRPVRCVPARALVQTTMPRPTPTATRYGAQRGHARRAAASPACSTRARRRSPAAPPRLDSSPKLPVVVEVVREDVQLAVALSPGVVLGRVADERGRQGAVARVPHHLVDGDRRVADRERGAPGRRPRPRPAARRAPRLRARRGPTRGQGARGRSRGW